MTEKEKNELVEKLAEAQKFEAIGRFAGGMAHDFNNLLSAILGLADLALLEVEPESSVARDLKDIRAAAEKAAGLTQQLLAFGVLRKQRSAQEDPAAEKIPLEGALDQVALDQMALDDAVVAGSSETVVLVAEDETFVRELIGRILGAEGFKVLAAANGEHALEVARRFAGRIDLLLSDVMMPKMNGRELAEKLAAERPGIKVLFISGYTDDLINAQGMLPGGHYLLRKPFSPEELRRRITAELTAPS